MTWLKLNIKGLLLSLSVAIVAALLGNLLPIVGGAVFGIILGILFGNIIGLPKDTSSGIKFTSKIILQWAIIILGGGLSLTQVYQRGLSSLLVMIYTLSAAFIAAYLFGKLLKVPFKITTLIGMGTAICGGSAIAAIAPIIEAEDKDIAYSISTVFMFNVAAVLVFPVIGHLIGLSQHGFGLWAGTAINDTSSVVAAAYSYGNDAGTYATIVKLTRTIMIIPISMIFAVIIMFKKSKESVKTNTKYSFTKIFPWFILGFLGASLLNTSGIISPEAGKSCTEIGKFLIIWALSAIGLNSDFKQMLKTGAKPMFLGLIVWVITAIVSLIVQKLSGQI
ncbi:MAG: putative sulfate exporter family transporter [bacterium]